MRSLTRKALRYILLATVFGVSGTAMAQRGPVLRSGNGTAHVESLNGGNIPQPRIAASAVTVTPATGARFAVGQKFDIRVEGKGTGPFSATLSINNGSGTVPLTFTSGAQNTTTTDGITSAGYGGFNVRGYSIATPGTYTLTATFTDATGTVTQNSQIEVSDVRGNRRPAKNVIIMLGDGMGIAHTTAAQIVKFGVTAGHPNDKLAMQQFPGTGLVSTHSLNSIITDSAPGMACYTSGNHFNNNQEGVFPANVTNAFFAPRVEYLSEYMHRTKRTSLGLVSTADVEDATIAANAVHTINRGAGQGICDQYLDESDWQGTGTFGTGLSVLMRVALVVPLTQGAGQSVVGASLRNGADLALSESGADALTILVKDDRSTPDGARAAAQEALNEGAELFIGPLFAADVREVGRVARSAGKPVIGFSTDTTTAARGIYLLSFLIESYVDRIVGYAADKGKKSFAVLAPDNEYGTVALAEFQQEAARRGLRVMGIERYKAGGAAAAAQKIAALGIADRRALRAGTGRSHGWRLAGALGSRHRSPARADLGHRPLERCAGAQSAGAAGGRGSRRPRMPASTLLPSATRPNTVPIRRGSRRLPMTRCRLPPRWRARRGRSGFRRAC